MDIVEELRQDREAGAKRLESEYRAGLLAMARRLCSDLSDADELVNRTFAAVVAGIDDYLEQSAFFGWMCRIMINLNSADRRRRSDRDVTYPGDLPEIGTWGQTTPDYKPLLIANSPNENMPIHRTLLISWCKLRGSLRDRLRGN